MVIAWLFAFATLVYLALAALSYPYMIRILRMERRTKGRFYRKIGILSIGITILLIVMSLSVFSVAAAQSQTDPSQAFWRIALLLILPMILAFNLLDLWRGQWCDLNGRLRQ